MGAVMSAWLAEMAIQTWKGGPGSRVPPGLPVPSIYLADMVIFGMLAFGAKESSKAAPVVGLLAWGLVVATLLNNPLAPAALSAKLTGTSSPTSGTTTTATAGGTTPRVTGPGGAGGIT